MAEDLHPASRRAPKSKPSAQANKMVRAAVRVSTVGVVPKFAEVGALIERNLTLLKKPGILAVRPGYHIQGGFPVGDPVIVALVGSKKGEASAYGLPPQLNGVPIEVREASPMEQMRATRPDLYDVVKNRASPELQSPVFPYQGALVSAAAPADAAAAAAAAAASKPEIPYAPAGVPLDAISD